MFDRMTPHAITGLVAGQGSPATGASAIPSIGRSAGPAATGGDKPWHPDNPLFWFGAVAAVTLGLIAANATIRVGPFKASAGASKKS